MDNMSSLRNFDSVWQRVNPTSSAAAPPADDRAVLQRLIQDEYESHSLYKCLASRVKGKNARLFSSLAAGEARHLKHLQLEYLLLTGDSYAPASYVCPRDGALTLVRTAYVGEAAAEKYYLDAARTTSRQSLQKIYLAHSADENRHGRMLRSVLMNSMN